MANNFGSAECTRGVYAQCCHNQRGQHICISSSALMECTCSVLELSSGVPHDSSQVVPLRVLPRPIQLSAKSAFQGTMAAPANSDALHGDLTVHLKRAVKLYNAETLGMSFIGKAVAKVGGLKIDPYVNIKLGGMLLLNSMMVVNLATGTTISAARVSTLSCAHGTRSGRNVRNAGRACACGSARVYSCMRSPADLVCRVGGRGAGCACLKGPGHCLDSVSSASLEPPRRPPL